MYGNNYALICLQVLLPARVGHLLDVDAGRGYSLIGQLLSESSFYHVLDEDEPAENVYPLPASVLGTWHPHTVSGEECECVCMYTQWLLNF